MRLQKRWSSSVGDSEFQQNALNSRLLNHIYAVSEQQQPAARTRRSLDDFKAQVEFQQTLPMPERRASSSASDATVKPKFARATRARGSGGIPPRRFELSDLEAMTEEQLIQALYDDPDLASTTATTTASREEPPPNESTSRRTMTTSLPSDRNRPAHVRQMMDNGVPVLQWLVLLALVVLAIYQVRKSLELPTKKGSAKKQATKRTADRVTSYGRKVVKAEGKKATANGFAGSRADQTTTATSWQQPNQLQANNKPNHNDSKANPVPQNANTIADCEGISKKNATKSKKKASEMSKTLLSPEGKSPYRVRSIAKPNPPGRPQVSVEEVHDERPTHPDPNNDSQANNYDDGDKAWTPVAAKSFNHPKVANGSCPVKGINSDIQSANGTALVSSNPQTTPIESALSHGAQPGHLPARGSEVPANGETNMRTNVNTKTADSPSAETCLLRKLQMPPVTTEGDAALARNLQLEEDNLAQERLQVNSDNNDAWAEVASKKKRKG